MAEAVARHHAQQQRLDWVFESCGTHGFHAGEGADSRAIATLQKHGIDPSGLYSRPLCGDDYIGFDYLICMDRSHQSLVEGKRPYGIETPCRLLRDFSGEGGDVSDPYYGGQDGFDHVFHVIQHSVLAMIALYCNKEVLPLNAS